MSRKSPPDSTRADGANSATGATRATGATGARGIWRFAARSRLGVARGFLRFWPLYERVTLWLWHVRGIPGAPYDIVHVRVLRYHGRPITLPDGTAAGPGDRVIEIHLNNPVVVATMREHSFWDVVQRVGADLGALARWLPDQRELDDVVALYGLSMLSHAAPRLGFTVRDRPVTIVARLDRFFLTGLLMLYAHDGGDRLRHGSTASHFPQEIWMSRQALSQRYGQTPSS